MMINLFDGGGGSPSNLASLGIGIGKDWPERGLFFGQNLADRPMESIQVSLPFLLTQGLKSTTTVKINQPSLTLCINQNVVHIQVSMPDALGMHSGNRLSGGLPGINLLT